MDFLTRNHLVDSAIAPIKQSKIICVSQITVTQQPGKSLPPSNKAEQQVRFLKILSSLISIITAIIIIGGGVLLLTVSTKGIVLQTVLTGSMSPALPTGAVSLVVPRTNLTSSYNQNDVIAFKNKEGVTVTHRIVNVRSENGDTMYQTKGDANSASDDSLVTHQAVLGQSIFGLPYLGYLLSTLRTKIGFALMILVPASILAMHELQGMWEALQQIRSARKNQRALKRIIPLTAAVTSVVLTFVTVPTFAILTDTATVSPNIVSVADVLPSPTPTITPSPSPTVEPTPTSTPTPSPTVEPTPTPTSTPSPSPDPCSNDATINHSNTNTGNNSVNDNDTTITSECETTTNNETTITNTIDISASTGNNSSTGNTNGGTTTSGNVNLSISVENQH